MRLVTSVHSTVPMGGVEWNVYQVSRELARRGHQVDLIYRESGSLVPDYRRFCHSVTKVPEVDYWYPTGRRGRPKQLAKVLPAAAVTVRRRPDLIYGSRMMSTGWAIPAGKVLGAPIVCHEHGYGEQLSQRRIDRLRRHVDRFVVVSQFVADQWLALGLDPDQVEVVFNGIDPAEYPIGGAEERSAARRALDIGEDVFVVTCVGRLDREKGVHVLLDAWRRLGLSPDEGALVVMGSSTVHRDADAYRAELRAMATDSVRFVPGQRDVVTPLHAADVAVVPSVVQESFGRTVIEALSTGRPVLASRVGGIPEIMSGPLRRFLFEQGDAEALAEGLRGLMDWREREPELGGLCRSRVLEQFTLARMVDGIESAFRSVL
ncbi:MAG: glycosyltransferase family 4 protein [Acidimicrobiales bacterium]|jgi:glycosyltransferase involved in cell wall biosynthesis